MKGTQTREVEYTLEIESTVTDTVYKLTYRTTSVEFVSSSLPQCIEHCQNSELHACVKVPVLEYSSTTVLEYLYRYISLEVHSDLSAQPRDRAPALSTPAVDVHRCEQSDPRCGRPARRRPRRALALGSRRVTVQPRLYTRETPAGLGPGSSIDSEAISFKRLHAQMSRFLSQNPLARTCKNYMNDFACIFKSSYYHYMAGWMHDTL